MTVTAHFLPTTATGGASWVNPNNVKTDDGVVASSSMSRTIDYPYGYVQTRTSNLTCSAFTGLTAGMNAGDSIDGYEVIVRARTSSNAARVYLRAQMSFDSDQKEELLTESWQTLTFGGATDKWGWDGVVSNPTTLADYFKPVISAGMTSGTGSQTVEVDYLKMRVWWRDTTVDPFTFTAQTNVAVDEWVYSNIITIAGLPVGETVPYLFYGSLYEYGYRQGVEIQKNSNGKWVYDYYLGEGTTQNGDTFQIRRKLPYSSPDNQNADDFYLTINGVTGYFSTTSTTPDRTPALPTMNNLTGLQLGQWVNVGTFRVKDVNVLSTGDALTGAYAFASYGAAASTISQTFHYLTKSDTVPQSMIPFVGGPYDATYKYPIFDGTEVQVLALTPAAWGSNNTMTLTAGSVTPTASFNTETSAVPSPFYFTATTASTSTLVTSNTITITGLKGTTCTPTSFFLQNASGGEFSKNGGAWTAIASPPTLTNGDTLQVRMTTSGTPAIISAMLVNITGYRNAFMVGTTGADIVPDAPTVTALTNQIPGYRCYRSFTLSGLTPGIDYMVCASRDALVNASSSPAYWGVGVANCRNGDTVTIAPIAPAPGVTEFTTITILNQLATLSVTSRSGAGVFE